jgi:hypothetical protein
MGSKIYHVSLSVKGALRQRKKITYMEDNGKQISDAEAREFLMQCLSEGKRLIPIGKECEGYSYETGCPGHEVKKLKTNEKERVHPNSKV